MKIKKLIKKFIPQKKIDLHGFDYTVNELINMYDKSHEYINWHGSIISNEIINFKKSDTVFILGSGPSINKITKEQWNVISKHDSIGFNYWLVHDFVPTMYMFQIPRKNQSKERMLNILEERYSSYRKIPFIIRGSGFAKGEINFNDERIKLLEGSPVYYLNEYPISGRCSIEPILLYKYMEALGFMSHGAISKFIPKWRSTLGLLLMLSYQIGYKKIVLCGMDMKNDDHFWDYEPNNKLKNKYNLPGIGSSKITDLNDLRKTSNTVSRYIYTLNNWFKSKNNVEIFISNDETILYPEIGLFNFK